MTNQISVGNSGSLGRFIGMIAIIAGTTIGAGMLAMPLTSAGMGFTASVALLVVLWAVLTICALYFVELYQFTDAKKGLSDLSGEYYGPIAKVAIVIVLFLFLYAITTAYILGGSSIIAKNFNLTALQSSIIFVVVFGLPVVLGARIIDFFNRILFFAMLIAFLVLIVLIIPNVKGYNLLAMPVDNLLIVSATPVFFTAFGFHVVVPNVVSYLDKRIKLIRGAMIIGTLVPLAIYVLWQLAIHGIIGQEEFIKAVQSDASITGLAAAVGEKYGSLFGGIISVFSALALVTSFIGVSLGSISLFNDLTKNTTSRLIKNNLVTKFLFAYLVPVLCALYFVGAFVAVIGYAGVLFAIYVVLLPVACVFKSRIVHKDRYTKTTYKVFGGSALLVLTLLIGIATILIPYLMTQGILPVVKS